MNEEKKKQYESQLNSPVPGHLRHRIEGHQGQEFLHHFDSSVYVCVHNDH